MAALTPDLSKFGTTSTMQNSESGTTLSPAVLTSGAADNHINNVVKPALAEATSGMQAQAAKTQATSSTPSQVQTPTTSATTLAPSTSTSSQTSPSTYTYISTDGTSKTVQAASPNEAMTKASDIAAHSGVQLAPAAQQTTPSSTTQPTDTPPNPGTEPSSTDVQKSQVANDQSSLKQAQDEYQATAKSVHDTILNIQNGSIPLNAGEQAQVTGLQQQFNALIQDQTVQNTGASGLANVRGYQTGAAEYDPSFQVKTIGSIVSAGNQRIADLNTKMAASVASLIQSFHDNDIKAVKDAYVAFQDASNNRQQALKDTIAQTTAAIKDARDQQQKVTDGINAIAVEAAKNGADPKTLAAISSAGSVSNAVAAAGGALQTATGQLGDYLQYKRDTIGKGLTPTDYATWKVKDDAAQAKAKANAAYSSAYASAAGKAAAESKYGGSTPSGTTDTSGSPTAGGITQATGLSLAAFNYLTQGTASMSRMPAAQRNAIMAEANAYLNKTGTDVATFQSQYKAYNQALQKNIERANNTKIFAGEVSGTVDQFIQDTGENFGSLNIGNVAKLLAGKQVNDPTVQKYAFNLQTMQNDLAGYYAASRGATAPDDADLRAAAGVITQGLNAKSAAAFQDSINSNEEKVTGVVDKAAENAQKQVWDLFGVGSKFQTKSSSIDPKSAVVKYVSDNPGQAQTVSSLYKLPGWTDQDVLDYVNSHPSQ